MPRNDGGSNGARLEQFGRMQLACFAAVAHGRAAYAPSALRLEKAGTEGEAVSLHQGNLAAESEFGTERTVAKQEALRLYLKWIRSITHVRWPVCFALLCRHRWFEHHVRTKG